MQLTLENMIPAKIRRVDIDCMRSLRYKVRELVMKQTYDDYVLGNHQLSDYYQISASKWHI